MIHRRVRRAAAIRPTNCRDPRRSWAQLIKRIYEVDPLVCSSCGGEMKVISVILEHKVIRKILGHLTRKGIRPGRDPPEGSRCSHS